MLIENGEISTLGIGQTDLTIVHNDESESYYRLIVSEPEKSSVAESKSENKVTEASDGGSSSRTAVIIAVVIAGIAAIAVEYIIIVKPFDKHKDSKPWFMSRILPAKGSQMRPAAIPMKLILPVILKKAETKSEINMMIKSLLRYLHTVGGR